VRQVINENYVMKLPTEKSHTDYKEKEKKRKRRLYENNNKIST